MATQTPVGPDTPVTVKVSLNAEFRRFKLPLKDLGPATFPEKLRTLLAVKPHQNLLLERYSDSAASFIALEPQNTVVYKQLYRAAKAKLKLRIRATVTDPTMPTAVEDTTKEEQKLPTLMTVISRSAAPADKPAIPAVKPTGSARLDYESQLRALEYQNQLRVLAAKGEQAGAKPAASNPEKDILLPEAPHQPAGPRRPQSIPILKSSLYTAPIGCRASLDAKSSQETLTNKAGYLHRAMHHGATQFSVCCNVCNSEIPSVHWHCSICQNGDYDLCAACVDLGHHCEVDSHFLIKRIIENGKVINATLETISKKFGPVTAKQDAETSRAVSQPEAPSRTCNSCIGVFEEDKFVTCAVCEDFDLCVPCLLAMKHGHHPAHSFEAATVNTKLDARAKALCGAGRNKYHHAICDGCEKKIRGIRHKCFECPDFDLCDQCVTQAHSLHPQHRFAPLYDTIRIPHGAPVHAEHTGVTCDGPLCQGGVKNYIRGVRYKCAVCHDTDFCAACEAIPHNPHNRTHPLIQFRTPVAHVSVSTFDEGRANARTPLGDRSAAVPPLTFSKATETTAPVNATTQVQTVAEIKPVDRTKDLISPARAASPSIPYNGIFLSDVIPDGSKMPASQVFRQTWTIQNPGPVAWPVGCCLRFVGGDRMLNMDADRPASTEDLDRAVSSNIADRSVGVGENVQFSVVLKAPARAGKAISYWRIKTPDGQAFGHKLWCEIDVTAPPSEPSSPAQPPITMAEFTRLNSLVHDKSDEISRLTGALSELQRQLAGAKAEKAAALGDVQANMQSQRRELLAKLEEVQREAERTRASQATSQSQSAVIFPKLEKESPEASVYENAREGLGEEAHPKKEAEVKEEEAKETKKEQDGEDDLVEEMESLDMEDSDDDGFLTDEEYEILDSEFDDLASEAAK